MAEPFLGSIIIFGGNFAPRGWAFCAGQTLAINQNTALFSLLGTTYGGNGQTTFQLPDLRGRVPLGFTPSGFTPGPGLSSYSEGQTGGVESVTLTSAQIPQHTHSQPATAADQTTNRPNAAVPARGGFYGSSPDGSTLAATTSAGGGQAHENRSPFLAINYIIALEGIFPSRN